MGCTGSKPKDKVRYEQTSAVPQPLQKASGLNYAGLDLPQVRAIINKADLGDEKRRKLLHMAGRSPELWHGCLPEDIVHVLEIQLEAEEGGNLGPQAGRQQQQATAIGVPQHTQPEPVYIPVQQQPTVHYVQPSPVFVSHHGSVGRSGVGSAIVGGIIAGRVAGRTAARSAGRRRC